MAMPADPELEGEGQPHPPPSQSPLLDRATLSEHTQLDLALHRLELFLSLLGFSHSSSPRSLLFSCSLFLLLGVAVPVASVYLSGCWEDGCEVDQVGRFELFVLASQVSLAVVSLACVSLNLRRYGVRRFLFVDHDHGQLERFRKEYEEKIQAFFYSLFWWILPCFLVKTAREVIRFLDTQQDSLWKFIVILVASIVAWTYLTAIFLSACALFNLVCNLQVIHFEDFGKLFEREIDVIQFLEEHVCLHYYLSKISHRFRIYLLLIFLFVSTSQVVTLFQTTGYSGIINFTNTGDFAVSSVVQVVGIILCLHSAAKISHRAQGIASLASKWHALITCSSPDASEVRFTNSSGNLRTIPSVSLAINCSESDLESLDNAAVQTNFHVTSYLSSYHQRESLVAYLHGNPGGITIFGWTVDRALINTIFFIELSLVLFVLGKTIVFSAK
uniref:Putative protease AXL1 n=1 Tax=Anthurium amnicola TaxID=1678845 RepID=A0A1D1Y9R4_9ARAE